MTKRRIEEVYRALPTIEDLDRPQARVELWGTTEHLSIVVRMTRSNVTQNLIKLKNDDRAHVHAWTPDSKAAIWAQGPGVNARRPVTDAEELKRRSRERVKMLREQQRLEGVVKVETISARATTQATIHRAKAKPCNWFAALGSVDDQDGEQVA
jgi:hypothetical protein